jgi:hypothetical protein
MPTDDSLDAPPTPGAGAGALRWWPALAAAFGVAGLAWAGSLAGFAIGGMLVICSLALELGGWAELSRSHGRRLATAAMCGALVGTAVIGVAHLRGIDIDSATPDRIALGR